MTHIFSIGKGIPPNEINQSDVKRLIKSIFSSDDMDIERLLPVFDHAKIKQRQLVVNEEWFLKDHSFQEKNSLYEQHAIHLSMEAIEECLTNRNFLKENIPFEAIDIIFFVSSTGIATPTIDTHIINKMQFRDDVIRVPLWGLGCAGGAIGISRAVDYLKAYPNKTALLICCELCSLTFQKEDTRVSNLVGTALFGDGASAALLVGAESPYITYKNKVVPKVKQSHSLTKKNSTSVMGWELTNNGLQVIFSKEIPHLVTSFWRYHIEMFLNLIEKNKKEIHSYIAHPGGRKVLEAMEHAASISEDKLKYSYDVLLNHGNMSSVTVLYVLHEWMLSNVPAESYSILSALGPGFSSELLLMEWV